MGGNDETLVALLWISETLKKVVKGYYDRVYIIEEQKWDLELDVRKRDFEVPNKTVIDLWLRVWIISI